MLCYADPRGDPRLRSALATMVASVRGLAATPDALLVTRGNQVALDAVARTLIAPGDIVAVEALGHRSAREALRLAGARSSRSKILAPGLRVGFVVAPPPLVERLAAVHTGVDRQGDHGDERAAAELIEDGEVLRHARRVRRIYEARRDALATSLRRALGGTLATSPPVGWRFGRARTMPSTSTRGRFGRWRRGSRSIRGAGSRSTASGVRSPGSASRRSTKRLRLASTLRG
jgi:DNA-binding transcriptional MocR family regulator